MLAALGWPSTCFAPRASSTPPRPSRKRRTSFAAPSRTRGATDMSTSSRQCRCRQRPTPLTPLARPIGAESRGTPPTAHLLRSPPRTPAQSPCRASGRRRCGRRVTRQQRLMSGAAATTPTHPPFTPSRAAQPPSHVAAHALAAPYAASSRDTHPAASQAGSVAGASQGSGLLLQPVAGGTASLAPLLEARLRSRRSTSTPRTRPYGQAPDAPPRALRLLPPRRALSSGWRRRCHAAASRRRHGAPRAVARGAPAIASLD